MKPEFAVTENAIQIVLPILDITPNLSKDEAAVYKVLSRTIVKPIRDIDPLLPFGRSKTIQLLKGMEQKGIVRVEGKARGTKYILK